MFQDAKEYHQVQTAARVWLAVFIAYLLTSALFFAPHLAAHGDFGHTHPEGIPPHVHAIDAVLGSAVAADATVVAGFVLAVVFFITCGTLHGLASGWRQSQRARAPPLKFSLQRL